MMIMLVLDTISVKKNPTYTSLRKDNRGSFLMTSNIVVTSIYSKLVWKSIYLVFYLKTLEINGKTLYFILYSQKIDNTCLTLTQYSDIITQYYEKQRLPLSCWGNSAPRKHLRKTIMQEKMYEKKQQLKYPINIFSQIFSFNSLVLCYFSTYLIFILSYGLYMIFCFSWYRVRL